MSMPMGMKMMLSSMGVDAEKLAQAFDSMQTQIPEWVKSIETKMQSIDARLEDIQESLKANQILLLKGVHNGATSDSGDSDSDASSSGTGTTNQPN